MGHFRESCSPPSSSSTQPTTPTNRISMARTQATTTWAPYAFHFPVSSPRCRACPPTDLPDPFPWGDDHASTCLSLQPWMPKTESTRSFDLLFHAGLAPEPRLREQLGWC